ncbi:MAG: beta-propeller fold lactonase family protein [Verrucomicrobia bacterium]|nr:beta-propeller fold lactonase family protein [Verrucomicrobiota bacterium]
MDRFVQRLKRVLNSVAAASLLAGTVAQSSQPACLSPAALVVSPDGATLYIACATADRVLVFDTATRKMKRSITTTPCPTGLCLSADGTRLFVTCAAPESRVCMVETPSGKVAGEFSAGHTAMAPVLSPDGRTLFVCNRFNNDVSVFDWAAKRELRRIAVRREPVAAAITPDGKRLLVANHLPAGRADVEHVAAVVSVIDTARGQVVDDLWLPNGSGAVNDVRVSPDGRFAVLTHLIGRFWRPATQIERGAMNSNAMTIIALDRMEVLNTVLFDNWDRGAANPWGVAWSADSRTLVVTHAGTHEVSVIDFPALLAKLVDMPAALPRINVPYVFGAPANAPTDASNDLSLLAGARERRRLPKDNLGPRGVVVVGRRAYVANYFSDTLNVIELDRLSPKVETIPLGPKPRMTAARLGELYFHDARLCFQGWQSCSSCHPGDARVDALNWDLPNDGLGNPKNTKSLLLAHKTAPVMSLGQRETAEAAVRVGIQRILLTLQPDKVASAMDAYLKSRKPIPSPHLVNGNLSPAALHGEKLFHSAETRCAHCHPPPLFTDLRSHDVGTRGPADRDTDKFDTPSLVELWRTAPYLHDGSVATLRDLLVFSNKDDRHGRTSHLGADDIADLCEFLLSL